MHGLVHRRQLCHEHLGSHGLSTSAAVRRGTKGYPVNLEARQRVRTWSTLRRSERPTQHKFGTPGTTASSQSTHVLLVPVRLQRELLPPFQSTWLDLDPTLPCWPPFSIPPHKDMWHRQLFDPVVRAPITPHEFAEGKALRWLASCVGGVEFRVGVNEGKAQRWLAACVGGVECSL